VQLGPPQSPPNLTFFLASSQFLLSSSGNCEFLVVPFPESSTGIFLRFLMISLPLRKCQLPPSQPFLQISSCLNLLLLYIHISSPPLPFLLLLRFPFFLPPGPLASSRPFSLPAFVWATVPPRAFVFRSPCTPSRTELRHPGSFEYDPVALRPPSLLVTCFGFSFLSFLSPLGLVFPSSLKCSPVTGRFPETDSPSSLIPRRSGSCVKEAVPRYSDLPL